ncbi:MAG: sulfatase [Actinomycetota bacterium]
MPSRIRTLAVVLACGLLVSAPSLGPGHAATKRAPHHVRARPNIVLILTDDQRYDTLWAMPHVKRMLIRHGVRFTNAFVVNPLCCPSRTSILTGKYSHGTDVYKNTPPHGGFASFNDKSTIATWLHGAHYHTGLVGKYLNGYGDLKGRSYVPPGWDGWFAMLAPNGYYQYVIKTKHRRISYATRHDDYSTAVLGDSAVQFLRKATSPFFLYYAPYAPHLPATAPPRDENSFGKLRPLRTPSFGEADVSDKPAWIQERPAFADADNEWAATVRRIQYQSLLEVDRTVAAIVNELRATGQLDNTMIVFMSDNGIMWGEHRLIGLKEVPYEESIRVPMVIRYDPLTKKARRDSHFVLNIDLAPTFAALAGVKAPGVEGVSLLPLLRRNAKSWRTDFLVEHMKGGHPPDTYCAIRNQQYKYVLYSNGEEELYDLTADPYELDNLAGDLTAQPTLLQMHQRLTQLCNPPPPKYSAVTGTPTPGPTLMPSVVPTPSPSSTASASPGVTGR